MGRWQWLAGAVAVAGGAALASYSTVVAPRELRIYRRAVHLPRLPRAFHDYRILHLSDLHVGGLSSGTDGVLAAAGLRADLIAITGDMLESRRYTEACAHLLGSLQATDGVVCVLGNHDFGLRPSARHAADLVRALARRGVRTLINAAMPLERGGERIWLVGVNDPFTYRANPTRAFAEVPADAVSILLAHSPDICALLPPGRADLVLSGHCHGGQIRTPFGPIVTRARGKFPDVLGLQDVAGTPVHMSGGLGSTLPPRLLCPPEATVLHLAAGEDGQPVGTRGEA
jgi:predicted MPP superfamily phosphohydrolase